MNHIDPTDLDLSALYADRFDEADRAYKRALWEVLCQRFFQRYVRPSDTVLDLGAGSGEFLNAIECGRKIAVDLDPNCAAQVGDADFYRVPGNAMTPIPDGSVDVVFCSNFFEHLPDKGVLLETLRECHRVLNSNGHLLIMQPNIRYLAGRYWDYLDHHTPLTHVSMCEALSLTGFEPEDVVPRFLPYTVKDRRLPRSLWLVWLYLKLRFLWPVFGRQMFIAARRR